MKSKTFTDYLLCITTRMDAWMYSPPITNQFGLCHTFTAGLFMFLIQGEGMSNKMNNLTWTTISIPVIPICSSYHHSIFFIEEGR